MYYYYYFFLSKIRKVKSDNILNTISEILYDLFFLQFKIISPHFRNSGHTLILKLEISKLRNVIQNRMCKARKFLAY